MFRDHFADIGGHKPVMDPSQRVRVSKMNPDSVFIKKDGIYDADNGRFVDQRILTT